MTGDSTNYTDEEAARALVQAVGDARWDAVALAKGFLATRSGADDEVAARAIYDSGTRTLRDCRLAVDKMKKAGFLSALTARKRVGSAENPVTKLFPATVTEERFLEVLEAMREDGATFDVGDERETRHSLADFYLRSGEHELPINVKTASTAFEKAKDLVGLDSEDCIPIPVYKASAAVEKHPSLLYVVSVDFTLVATLDKLLPTLLTRDESIAWSLLNKHEGTGLKKAEDAFVFRTVRKHWGVFREQVEANPFHAISARKSLRVLQTKPKRTPGIGLRAWGTGASAEVNVHCSIAEDTTPWEEVGGRIVARGMKDVVEAINRRRQEWVYDPEI